MDKNYTSTLSQEVYNYSAGNFRKEDHCTSHIENTLVFLKNSLKNIYNIIHTKNYIYFIRGIELRINIMKKADEEKLSLFKDILKNVYGLNEFNFYEEDEILDFNNYDY